MGSKIANIMKLTIVRTPNGYYTIAVLLKEGSEARRLRWGHIKMPVLFNIEREAQYAVERIITGDWFVTNQECSDEVTLSDIIISKDWLSAMSGVSVEQLNVTAPEACHSVLMKVLTKVACGELRPELDKLTDNELAVNDAIRTIRRIINSDDNFSDVDAWHEDLAKLSDKLSADITRRLYP